MGGSVGKQPGNAEVSLSRPPAALGDTRNGEVEFVAMREVAEQFGDARLLISDIRVAFLLVNAARHRIVERLFGIPEDQQNLVTLIAVVMLADAVRDQASRLLPGRPVPSQADGLLGVASVGELLHSVAGPSSRGTPGVGARLAVAVVAGTAAPAAVKAARGAWATSHRLSVGFHHRYGYLVDPGQWRRRRAVRREAQGLVRFAATPSPAQPQSAPSQPC